MNFGVAFLFDEPTEAALRGLWQSLADAGLSNFMLGLDYPPHMTAWMAQEFDLAGMRGALQNLAAATPPQPVTFAALGVFGGETGVVYLAPITGPKLIDLHARFWSEAETHMRGAPVYYAPSQWVPHVTLGFNLGPGVLGAAVEVLASAPWPQSPAIRGVLLGEYHIGGGSKLETVEFSG